MSASLASLGPTSAGSATGAGPVLPLSMLSSEAARPPLLQNLPPYLQQPSICSLDSQF